MGAFPKQAAVMVLMTEEVSPKIIFTLRSKHLNQHAGEVCFPGGKWEPQDHSLLTTALRETHEEIGVSPGIIDVLSVGVVQTTGFGATGGDHPRHDGPGPFQGLGRQPHGPEDQQHVRPPG
ncbi:MAG: CoA pyrophosphatase [Sphingobacteriales bacterium]|nr:MAG: CoA pyrophosphatase [Sphingobacteriales bacterium]